ncbi:MAG: VWA domain-containing protein [Vicinamibacterales bacterium]
MFIAATVSAAGLALPGRSAAGPLDERWHGPRFQVSTDLVLLNVTVGNRPVLPPLTADRFEVFENGVPQDIQFFAGSEIPKDVAIVLDTSSSMTGKLAAVQEAAIGFVSTLKPGDRVSVVGVGSRVTNLQTLTPSPALAAAAIRRARPRGNTALYNAIYTTIDDLARSAVPGEVRRRVVTVFSDGEDTASVVGLDSLLDVARRSGIAIYTIAFDVPLRLPNGADRTRRTEAKFGLKALSTETGARSFFLTRMEQVGGTYAAIADELDRQYSLGYLSSNAEKDGGFRRLLVRLKGLAGLARTRRGYYAPAAE